MSKLCWISVVAVAMSVLVEGLTSPEIEIAEGGAIVDSKTRFTDLKSMLDSSKDSLKMDAMRRIINLVAKGRDVSELFPAVVKNVVAKNVELKKLVYVYLVRYAEEQQDLALLSISTFQRALKDPNQLIRGSALRVLSSIRVQMIAPIMLLAIKDSVRDMSAYVRKVAAHAIPKLYSLDESLQPDLIDCIDFLLGDKRTLVLGSAVYAFEETCPDHVHLIHRHYRSLCKALADVDEWGQITMIGLLTRYARSQFVAPNIFVDPDLILLLTSSRPLLQSRNCAVVMAVAQLFYHCAPQNQLHVISKALIRLLRGSREVQNVVLLNIATICSANSSMFEPYLKSFFVRPSDPTYIKVLKLQVMISLVTETNVQLVLRELQAYVGMSELADAAIHVIGQCAIRVSSVAESCLMKLVSLIASPNENVVSAAVVTLKRLLHSNAPLPLLTRVFCLIESIKAPQARACVVWLVTTHVNKIPTFAPDMLRIMAKTFPYEKDLVKLQTLNLAVRLWLLNPEECKLLVLYVMQLARFDQNYDIRDRCRYLRNLLFTDNKLSSFASEIFLSEKPSPVVQNSFKDREQFQHGTLSHFLNQRCLRYRDLPPFPDVAPNPLPRMVTDSAVAAPDDKIVSENGSEVEDFYSGDDVSDEVTAEETDEDEEYDESDEDEDGGDDEIGDDGSLETKAMYSCSGGGNTVPAISGNIDLLLDISLDKFSPFDRSIEAKHDDSFKLLLNHAAWPVGVSVDVKFIRESSVPLSTANLLLLRFFNTLSAPSPTIKLAPKETIGIKTSDSMEMCAIQAKKERIEQITIDFGDCVRASEWILEADDFSTVLTVGAPVGELMYPITMNEEEFDREASRLSGLYEHCGELLAFSSFKRIMKIVHCKSVIESDVKFCARTMSKKHLVLISFRGRKLSVRSESIVLGPLLFQFIIAKFENNHSDVNMQF